MENQVHPELVRAITETFESEFKRNGYTVDEHFDYNVWFLNQNSESSLSNFKEILSSTPSENDDIIKHLFFSAYNQNKSCNFKISVSAFINMIVKQLVNLHIDQQKSDKLLETYNSYDTVTKLEQTLSSFDSMHNNSDLTKSTITAWISSIEGNISQADYLFSLCSGFLKENDKVSVLEYKLNHIIRGQEETKLAFSNFEYSFKVIEFYSFESHEKNVTDNGSNLQFLVLKCDNLSSRKSEPVISSRKNFLDILLSNMSLLTNIHKKNKVVTVEFEIDLFGSTCFVDVKMKIDLDPLTLFGVLSKILQLQKNLIYYKVQVNLKFNTILNYFPEISKKVLNLLYAKEPKEDKCLVF